MVHVALATKVVPYSLPSENKADMKYANRPHPFPIPTILLALLIYLPLVCGVNLADIFRVKGGQIAGGLDNHKDVAQL